ncbi:MAG: hypothetical protein ACLU3I_03775 [Acutalibacteraceae bacterium]
MTALNIMDPEPSAVQGEPVIWLEFESGGVAACTTKAARARSTVWKTRPRSKLRSRPAKTRQTR